MLGANDLKTEFNHRSSKEIAKGLEELVEIINASTYGVDMKSPPQILLVGYPVLTNESFQGPDNDFIFLDGVKRSRKFSHDFSEMAKRHGCHYCDAAPHIKLSELDGLHFDKDAHENFANLVTKKIEAIFSDS